MADLTDQDEFESWLKNKSRDICLVVSARAALRAFPVFMEYFKAVTNGEIKTRPIVLSVIQAQALAYAAAKYPTKIPIIATESDQFAASTFLQNPNASDDAAEAAYSAFNYVSKVDNSSVAHVVFRSSASVANRAAVSADARLDAASIALSAMHVAAARDAEFINNGYSSNSLATEPLWLDERLDWVIRIWRQLETPLLDMNEDWDVWIRWYDAILDGRPTPGGEELDLYRVKLNSDDDWKRGPAHVNALIRAKETEIAGRGNLLGTTAEIDTAGTVIPIKSETFELEVPPQTTGALVFGSAGDGPIDVIKTAGASLILDTPDSRDSHSEVVRFVSIVIGLHEGESELPNNGNALACQEALLLRDSLGRSIKDVRPGLLIPRGEALRQRLSRNVAHDEMSDVAPLSNSMENAVSNVVSAYNVFVGLDPELSRRDDASFGPDAERNLISPDEGQELAKSARESGVITADAESAIGEEGKVAPSQPDPANRLSRRFSEGVKNFLRATVGKAIGWVKANPWKSTVGSAFATAKWVLANEQLLLKFFADHPAMLEILKSLIGYLKNLPLG